MSNVNLAGQARALPFTGLASLPLLLVGVVLSVVGLVTTLVRPKRAQSKTLEV